MIRTKCSCGNVEYRPGLIASAMGGGFELIQILSLLLKMAIASLITGMTMSYFNITVENLLFKFGFTKAEFADWVDQALSWAMPNMILGAFVIVPIWLIIVLLAPTSPKRSD